MSRIVMVLLAAFISLSCGWSQDEVSLLDEHTVVLYDFRAGNEEALRDQCGHSDLGLGADTPANLEPECGLLFDGATRYTTRLPVLTAPVTIEALVRLDGPSPGKVHGIFEQFDYLKSGCRFGIVGETAPRLEFQISDPVAGRMITLYGRTGLETGQWTHVAATYDGEMMRVFVNGEEDGQLAWAGGLVPASGSTIIGYWSGPQYYLDGALGYLRLSRTARTSFENGRHPTGPSYSPLRCVSVQYPPQRAYFYPAGTPFEMVFRLENRADQPVECRLRLEARLLDGDLTALPAITAQVPNQEVAEVRLPVQLTQRGLYLPTLVVEQGGKEVLRRPLPSFAIVEPLPPLADVPPTSRFGGQPTAHMPGSELVGMKWNRFWDYPTSWCEMQPDPDRFVWDRTDQLVEEALARGEAILWCLCLTPTWASSIPDRDTVLADARLKSWYGDGLPALYDSGRLAWQYPPRDLADWARYVEAVVQRYKDRVKHWEIWNEANSGHFIGTPQQYLEVLRTAYETIKRCDPEAVVVGIAGCPGWMGFTEEVLKLGGLDYMDVLSFHDYAYAPPETFGCDRKVAETRELMARYGRVLPMWNTEVGFPIPPRVNGRPMRWDEFQQHLRRTADGDPAHPFFAMCVITRREPEVDCTYGAIWPTTEDRAARYLVRQFVLEMSEGMEKFQVHAGAPISRGTMPLLPGIAHAMMAKALSTARFVARIPTPSPSAYLYQFSTDSGPVVVGWTTAPEEELLILTQTPHIATADLYGNPGQVVAEDGRLVLSLTDSPRYFFGWPEDAGVWNPVEAATASVAVAGETLAVTLSASGPNTGGLVGDLRLENLPAGWTVQPTSETVSVAPGERASRHFTVNVPADAGPGSVTLSATLTAEGQTWTVPVPLLVLRPVPCPPAPEGFTLDGDLAEWASIPAHTIDTADQVVLGSPSPMFEKLEGTWAGPDDLSATLRFAQADEGLWIAVEVTDDSLTRPQTLLPYAYQWDCVELFLDGRNLEQQSVASYGPGVVQAFITPPDEDGHCANHVLYGTLGNLRARGQLRPTGYVLEICVPLDPAHFPVLNNPEKCILGFDVSIDDADGGRSRKVQMAWQGTARNCADPTRFARLRLR